MNKLFRHSLFPLFFITAAPFLIFSLKLFNNEIPFFMDIIAPFYPVKYLAAKIIHNGELPFWNNTCFGGVPMLSNPQWGFMYPFNWIFFLLPFGFIYTATQIIHFSIAGCGTYFYIRRISGGKSGAIIGAMMFSLSGYFFAHLAFGAFLFVAAWLPWAFLLFDYLLKAKNKKEQYILTILCGITVALQILAGAPQVAFYSIIGFIVYIFIAAIFSSKTMPLKSSVYFSFLIFSIGLIISAPQLIITKSFFSEIERSAGLEYETVRAGTLSIKMLLLSLVGGTGKPEDAETTMAITRYGFILFLVCAFFGRKNKKLLPHLAVGILSLVLILEIFSKPLFIVFPPYKFFHDPKRARFLLLFVIAVSTGTGWNIIIHKLLLKTRRSKNTVFVKTLSLFMSLMIFSLLVLFALSKMDLSFVPVKDAYADLKWKNIKPDSNDIFFSVDPTIHYTYAFRRAEFCQYLLPGISTYYGMQDFQGYDPAKPVRYAAFLSAINDGYIKLHDKHFGIIRNVISPLILKTGIKYVIGDVEYERLIFPESKIDSSKPFIAQSDSMYYSEGIRIEGNLLTSGNNIKYGTETGKLELFDSSQKLIHTIPLRAGIEVTNKSLQQTFASVERYADSQTSLTIVKGFYYNEQKMNKCAEFDDYDYRGETKFPKTMKPVYARIIWTDKQSEFYISSISLKRINPGNESGIYPEYKYIERIKLADQSELKLYEITNAKPQIEIVNNYIEAANKEEALELIRNQSLKAVVIETTDKKNNDAVQNQSQALKNTAPGTIDKITRRNNIMKIDVTSAADNNFLIIRQAYFRGWHAYLDGTETEILPADIMFQGLRMTNGKHEVVLKYNPFSK